MGDNVDPGEDGGGDHLDQKTDTLATNDVVEVTASHEESNTEQEKVRGARM